MQLFISFFGDLTIDELKTSAKSIRKQTFLGNTRNRLLLLSGKNFVPLIITIVNVYPSLSKKIIHKKYI